MLEIANWAMLILFAELTIEPIPSSHVFLSTPFLRNKHEISMLDLDPPPPLTISYWYNYAAAELGRNPVSKHHIQPEYGDEQADAGRDG